MVICILVWFPGCIVVVVWLYDVSMLGVAASMMVGAISASRIVVMSRFICRFWLGLL